MAIFAALALAGWQVFDSVNRARERAQGHADNLAVLQYAYLQLQQDMAQMIAYQAPIIQGPNSDNSKNNSSDNNNADNQQAIIPAPFMHLDSEQLSFVRFADPDPRYQTSPSLQRINYIVADERLIRRQYTTLDGGANSVSLDSILLEGISAANWQAYLPEISAKFPNTDNQSPANNSNSLGAKSAASTNAEVMLLPKGIGLSFTYNEMPISWQFALAPQALPANIDQTNSSTPTSSGNSNSASTADGSNTNNNNAGTSNSTLNSNTEQNLPVLP